MASAKTTIDHDTIRRWVEAHGGHPAHVKATGSGDDPGILRIDYPGFSGEDTLEEISWDQFFDAFEENELAFIYQDDKSSRFSKFISRANADLGGQESKPSKRAASGSKSRAKSSKKAEDTHAVRLLESQHREVESLFAAYEQADDPDEQESLFEQIADNLAAHARIEETIFYPECMTEATEDELREAVEEHLVIKRTLADLLELSPGDDEWEGKMTVLREQVEHHVHDEESKLFELVEEFADEDLVEMGARMLAKFQELIDQEPRHEVPEETERAAPLQ